MRYLLILAAIVVAYFVIVTVLNVTRLGITHDFKVEVGNASGAELCTEGPRQDVQVHVDESAPVSVGVGDCNVLTVVAVVELQ